MKYVVLRMSASELRLTRKGLLVGDSEKEMVFTAGRSPLHHTCNICLFIVDHAGRKGRGGVIGGGGPC